MQPDEAQASLYPLAMQDQVEAFARCLLSGVFDAENTRVRSRRDKINDSDVLK